MAGKRQHFIPQFLQEGFASRCEGENCYVWVYRKDQEPFETNIENVGAEGYFYTDGEDTEADDLITKAEGQFAKLVDHLRHCSAIGPANSEIAGLLAHLEVRTRHIRQSFLRLGSVVVDRFLQLMQDDDAFFRYLMRIVDEDPRLMISAIQKELPKYGIAESAAEDLWQAIRPYAPDLLAQQKADFSRLGRGLRGVLPKQLQSAAKSAQISALKRGVSPEPRVSKYAELQYFLVTSSEPLLLGDSIVLVEVDDGGRRFKAFAEGCAPIKQVYLPLSAWRLLVGTRDKEPHIPADLGELIAQTSLEYFVAPQRSDALTTLATRIGETALPLTDEELEHALGDFP